MISRIIESQIIVNLHDRKGIVIYGPRQSGKSTLLKMLEKSLKKPVLWLNGDDADTRVRFSDITSSNFSTIVANYNTIIIDEAQRIENIGLCLKIIIDNFPAVKVIATGSSAFELANKINEPLTGRKWEYHLYPFSFEEMKNTNGLFEELKMLNHRLVYGYYPDVINNPGKEAVILNELSNSYLYKDILTWERILKPDALEKLVRALAFQIGNEVSYHELGQMSGLDNETVERYIQLLERAFIVFRLGCFNRNLRTELKKSRKIYFYDNGIRNAIINQFNPIELRNDMGALWENFMVSERLKFKTYQNIYANTYFWRTKAQQEIDYIEEHSGQLFAYEFKWKPKSKFRLPSTFINEYKPTITELIHPENFDKFISK